MAKCPIHAGLVLGAVARHRDAALRERLSARLQAWVDQLEPDCSEREVRDLLRAEKGTLLLPFTMRQSELHAAVQTVRAAFSRAVGAEALQIVPPTGIGTSGGLRIRRDLTTSYDDHGNDLWQPGKTREGVMAFGRMPAPYRRGCEETPVRFKTKAHMGESGLSFVVPGESVGPEWRKRAMRLESRLTRTRPGAPPPPGKTQVEGLAVENPFKVERPPKKRGPVLKASDPTTLVKLFAVAAEGTWLSWRIESRFGIAKTVRVWLKLPRGSSSCTLHGLGTKEWEGPTCPWLSLALPEIRIDSEDVMALQAWFPGNAADAKRLLWEIPPRRGRRPSLTPTGAQP
jgi:hypothetical protein